MGSQDPAARGPLERWKRPITGLLIAIAVIGGATWLMRRPVEQPIAVPVTPSDGGAARTLKVHVAGAVARPGLYTVEDGLRVADALELAGGALEGADLSRVNLALRLRDQQQVVVPVGAGSAPTVAPSGAAAPASPTTPWAGPAPARRTTRPPVPRPDARLNVNQASATELEALPGIGPVTANRIVQYRHQHGAFPSLDDFRRARLVTNGTWERIRELVEAP